MPNLMSAAMRDILLQHIDGAEVPIIRRQEGSRAKSFSCLVRLGLIKPTKFSHPTHTVITALGRIALRRVLAEYADVLVRAGYRVEELRHAAETMRTAIPAQIQPAEIASAEA